MSEDTQNNLWSAFALIVVMALGALLWAVLKRIKFAVMRGLQNVRSKSARQEKSPAK